MPGVLLLRCTLLLWGVLPGCLLASVKQSSYKVELRSFSGTVVATYLAMATGASTSTKSSIVLLDANARVPLLYWCTVGVRFAGNPLKRAGADQLEANSTPLTLVGLVASCGVLVFLSVSYFGSLYVYLWFPLCLNSQQLQ